MSSWKGSCYRRRVRLLANFARDGPVPVVLWTHDGALRCVLRAWIGCLSRSMLEYGMELIFGDEAKRDRGSNTSRAW